MESITSKPHPHVTIAIEEDESGKENEEEEEEEEEFPPEYVPEFNIYDERRRMLFAFWVFFVIMMFTFIIGGTLYINHAYFTVYDPVPSFINTNILPGCRYEFFHQPQTFNESRRICEARKGYLVIFNNSLEDSNFNLFVTETFQPFFVNQTTNQWKRRGLQIWTGIRIVFQADRLTRLDWPNRMDCPMDMMKFYTDAQETRLCYATTMDRMRQYRKAMRSRRTNMQYIVKDFTGKFENFLGESTGCWQIRIVDESESLLLPFVCKSGSPLSIPELPPA